jgi:hypothetical protein
MMIVTKEWINNNKTINNGFTKKQLSVLGVDWPPKKGWVRQCIGMEITDKQKIEFENKTTNNQTLIPDLNDTI